MIELAATCVQKIERLTVNCCSIPFGIKRSEVVVDPEKRDLTLPSIMTFSSLATDASVRINVPLGISSSSRCLAWIAKQWFHVRWQIFDVDHG